MSKSYPAPTGEPYVDPVDGITSVHDTTDPNFKFFNGVLYERLGKGWIKVNEYYQEEANGITGGLTGDYWLLAGVVAVAYFNVFRTPKKKRHGSNKRRK